MTTSALLSFRAAVAAAVDFAEVGEAQANLGICLAQLGETEEAERILSDLRKSFSDGQYPRVSILTMILEGLCKYYKSTSSSSLDRVRRASALAMAGRLDGLFAEASVWMAHLAFNFESYLELKSSINSSLDRFGILGNTLRARICLTIADIYQYLGSHSQSLDWYKFSRAFSRKAHDHGLISTIEYNRLIIGLSRGRAERSLSDANGVHVNRDWFAELLSVQRLAEGFGGKALPELIDLCECFASQLSGNFVQAVAAMDRISLAGAVERCGMSSFLFSLERLWCLSKVPTKLGDDAEIYLDLSSIEALSPNDQLIALPLFADICRTTGKIYDESRFKRIWKSAEQHYLCTIESMQHSVQDCSGYFDQVKVEAMASS